MTMFEVATRVKVRFLSVKGELSIEQLWDVPLRANDNYNLNEIAKSISRNLHGMQEENFVDGAPSAKLAKEQMKLDIVKHVIATKQEDERKAKDLADKRAERARLVEILANKQDEKLSGLSTEQIEKRIRAIDAQQ